MRRVLTLSCLLLGCGPTELELLHENVALPEDVVAALAQLGSPTVLSTGPAGLPSFLRGSMGRYPVSDSRTTLSRVARVFRLDEADVALASSEQDELGRLHLRFDQTKHGVPVAGARLQLHLDSSRQLYAVSSTAFGEDVEPPAPSLSAELALARSGLATRQQRFGSARLVYLWAQRALRLAWELIVTSPGEGQGDLLYICAHTGALLERQPRLLSFERQVFSTDGTRVVPGREVRREGSGPSGDGAAEAQYDHLGSAARCFRELFGWQAFDAPGAVLRSTVHYGQKLNEAYWNGEQLLLGDGDGERYSNLARALDVTAHELGHGLTGETAGLAYRGESGALNEAMSDVLAAACEAHARNAVTPAVWTMAEDVYTPQTAGDALRYLADPARDGASADHYPERYVGFLDHGGVHTNSGIANLAFYLLANGGRHPRGKTSTAVPALGLERAARVFVRALQRYLGPTSDFAGARAATRQAALDLYGLEGERAVREAWSAVGVTAAGPEPFGPPEPLVNLAHGKPASASREGYLSKGPAIVVDQDLTTPQAVWHPGNPSRVGDFVGIDLGVPEELLGVTVVANAQNGHDWFGSFRIEVSSGSSFVTALTEPDWERARGGGNSVRYLFDAPRYARHLRLVGQHARDWVQLQELQVWGAPARNLAQGRAAWASRSGAPGRAPSVAVDGDTLTAGAVWHPGNPTLASDYWAVDLGREVGLERVVVVANAKNGHDFWQAFAVEGSLRSDFGQRVTLASEPSWDLARQERSSLGYAVLGSPTVRYVRLVPKGAAVGQAWVQLQELELWGRPRSP